MYIDNNKQITCYYCVSTFCFINGIAADNDGNLYCTTNNGLLIIDITKQTEYEFLKKKLYLRGIVFDGNETMFIVEKRFNKILGYNIRTNTFIEYLKPEIVRRGRSNIEYIAIDSEGYLYVSSKHQIFKVETATNTWNCIAGTDVPGFVDGPANQARFRNARGLAVDSVNNTVYVADSLNCCRIRAIKDGYVTTVAGFMEEIDYTFSEPTNILLAPNGNLLVSDKTEKLVELDFHHRTATCMTTRERREKFLCWDRDETLIVAVTLQVVYCLKSYWNRERLLWIALLKEDSSYCFLAMLPKDIIKEIRRFLHT